MPAIDATSLSAQSVAQSCATPKVISVPLAFNTATEFTLSLQEVQDIGGFDNVLGMFFDNFGNAARVDVRFEGTRQVIRVPAGAQLWCPVLVGNPTTVVFTTTGNQPVSAFLTNFEVQPGVWIP